MPKQTGSIADRLAALERRTTNPWASMSNQERDARAAAFIADKDGIRRAIAECDPRDERALAALKMALTLDV